VSEIPLEIERPERSEHLNTIIYGDSNAGKTWLAGTAADCMETLFIDVDSGMATLADRDIDVVRPRSWHDFQKLYEFLLDGDHDYECVVIDSLTEIQRKFSLGTILGDFAGGKDAYNDLGSTSVPTIKEWMMSGNQMRRLIRAFRDLTHQEDVSKRVHVIMVCLEKYDDKKRIICPNLSGTLGIECGAYVDVLGRLSKQMQNEVDEDGDLVEVIHRHLLVDDWIDDHGIRHMGKDRTGRLGRGIWDPTASDLLRATE